MSEEVSRAGLGCSGDNQAQGIAGASDPERLVDKIPVNRKGS